MHDDPPLAAETIAPVRLAGVPPGGRVVVAMSGGVDSSIVAALVAGSGYDTVGITLQLYDHGAAGGRKNACCAGQDIRDARAVADRIGIPHYVLDYEARFAEAVIAPFADSYLAGETPIPCVSCNQTVKFRDLLGFAHELGAEVLATGHYVESRPDESGFALYRAADPDRDQSYFLYATTRAQLQRLRFPLGAMRKEAVRALARRLALPVADKPDSQDICFVPSGRYADFVERLRPGAAEPGDIVDLDGRVLGRHDGIIGFTVGQRRGLGIAAATPLFVVRIDARRRQVVVGPRAATTVHEIAVDKLNWLGDRPLAEIGPEGAAIFLRVRSTGPLRPATLKPGEGGTRVEIAAGEDGVSPGQAAVFYADAGARARLLGGGTIVRTSLGARAAAVGAEALEPEPSLTA